MEMKNRRAALHNLGCKVNAYETEAMGQQLEAAGYTLVPFDGVADVYVINTCSVTNMADRKSRQMLHKAKKRNPEAVVVAAGCYVQTAKDKTHLDIDADIILGNNRKQDLVSVLDEYFAEHGKEAHKVQEDLIDINHTREYENLRISRSEEHTRAFMKVQDGCNQFCSYCIIPYARGRIRSRAVEDVVEEAGMLAKSGIREIVLTGIHLTSYGAEIGCDLITLIEKVAAVEGIERVRLGSLEPRVITKEFVERLSALPQACPHFHLSLQSGSDTVLERMNRKYTAEEFLAGCDLLREYFDDPALTTDVIVGFPGETEEEFAETVEFLRKVRFYETHIFKYSKREGTKAARMPEQIDESVKTKRSEVLIALGKENKAAYEQRHLDKHCEVLFEEQQEIGGQSYFVGHTREYMKACIPAGEKDLTNALLGGTLARGVGEMLLFNPDDSY